MVIGILGNGTTLIAVPYAYFRYRDDYVSMWSPVTFLMLHLSFCDLLYAILGLPSFLLIYSYGYFPLGNRLCWLQGWVRNWIALADFFTLGAIALTRLVGMVHNHTNNQAVRLNTFLSSFTGAIFLCMLAWIWSFLLIAPMTFELKVLGINFGAFGYNAEFGMCNHVSCLQKGFAPHSLITGFGCLLPFCAISISYLVVSAIVGRSVRQSLQTLEASQVDSGKLNRTLILISFSYTILCLPIVLIDTIGLWGLDEETVIFWTVVIYSFYFWIYAINFIVYLLSLKDFRRMYISLFCDLKSCLFAEEIYVVNE